MNAKGLIIHDLDDKTAKTIEFPDSYDVIAAREKAAFCQGCFGCWLKTPGACVYGDCLKEMGRRMSTSSQIIVITRNFYGGYSPEIKRIFDRSISASLPFFTYRSGQIHHPQRVKRERKLTFLFYGEISEFEKEIGQKLVKANGINMAVTEAKAEFKNQIECWEDIVWSIQ